MSVTRRQAVTFSVIVPLYDCRDAGTDALRAALAQTFARERYEVIAVVDAGADRAGSDALLAQCDRVVESTADFGAVESEIALFAAGSRAASGDWLFFTEGHTVLDPDALAALARHVEREPGCAIVCGRRRNHARTRLGELVGANNDVHESRAQRHGNFTLGANAPIRREAFVALGGLDARFARFGETVLYERALAARLRIDAIDAVLCTHHNDLGLRWLLRLLAATGRAKARPLRSLGEQRRATTRAASGLPPAARSGRGGRGRMAAAARGAGADPGVDGAGRTLARFRPRRLSRRCGLHGRFGLLRRACVRPSRKVVSHRTRAST